MSSPPVDMDILVSVTERDETPLHSAIIENNEDGVKIVLEECKKKGIFLKLRKF